ncbi:hypothetical protein MG290_08770 [Flavobacterium sp. CBA20B-1]|uniref:hypothetical protein n=1 Tax=unclassified Flavobacterium TaxID=196869 RepID=UPI002225A40F|nr:MULTISPECIES: hypothetical protein [unclassified Flavobacterium]WCM41052.1 hypothetical protein MG290_08770 [Flavobacterium sp. CBA20B-1]
MKKIRLSLLLMVSFSFYSCLSQDWVQIGEDILGDGRLNRIGLNYDLNLQGNTIAVTYSDRPKFVKVFELKNSKWIQVANTIVSKSKNSSFGDHLSINETGNLILISESQKNGDSIQNGVIHFLEKQDNNWIYRDSLIGKKNNDHLGLSFKTNSSVSAVVTAQQSNNQMEGQYNYEEVLVFHKNGNNMERLAKTITVNVPNSISKNLNFSNDGKIIAINYSISIKDKHYAIFEIHKISNGSFEKTQTLKVEKQNIFDVVNLSLSGNGQYLLLGFPDYRTDEKVALGKVMIYKIMDTEFEQIGGEITGENKYDYFGHRISINHDGNIISVTSSTSSTHKNGYVKTYKLKNNKWQQIGSTLEGLNTILNGTGNIVAIGNYRSNHENGTIKIYKFE